MDYASGMSECGVSMSLVLRNKDEYIVENEDCVIHVRYD